MLIGQTISHYKILEKLGEGGMGEVYLAEDRTLDRRVALKFLPAEMQQDNAARKRFLLEAKSAAALDHPYVCKIFEIGDAEGKDFISMEYVAGETLKDRLGRAPLPLKEALEKAAEIAEALETAHKHNIIHRDLKPSNIMLTPEGHVKVMDFGLAKRLLPAEGADGQEETLSASLTSSGVTVGTLAYMSPEQLRGEELDSRSDIFSFGIVLYEMLTRTHPFKKAQPMETGNAILNEVPLSLSALRSDDSPLLQHAVRKMLAKELHRRYQSIHEVHTDLDELKEDSDSERLVWKRQAVRPARQWVLALVVALALLGLGIAIGFAVWFIRPPAPAPQPILTRLTSDAGLTFQPAISPDGKLLAYASDRAGRENLDVWVKTVAGGQPSRRTRHQADDYEPSFSPDGSKIAFRSDRDNGGIYVMPTIAGEPQLIAERGRNPRFSPEGTRLAYWVGERVATNAQMYIVAVGGGSPRQLAAHFSAAAFPVWSPDGENLLFYGTPAPEAEPSRQLDPSSQDWYVIPADGGEPMKTGAMEALDLQEVEPYFYGPDSRPTWSDQGVIFSARLGDSVNLWRLPISPLTGQVDGLLERLTVGSGLEVQPSLATGGSLVFADLSQNMDVFSLPVDPNAGKPTGEIQRLTDDVAADIYPNLSRDSRTLAFLSARTGNRDVWTMDLDSGVQTNLTGTLQDEAYPIISPDGSKVAYTYRSGALYVKPTGGGVAKEVCGDCGDPFHWSSDGTKILFRIAYGPSAIGIFDLTTHTKTPVLRHPKYNLFGFQFSPDSQWIALQLNVPSFTQIFVVPFRQDRPPGEEDWIAVTNRDQLHFHPRWSPDGSLLYYQSTQDGFRCIWAQRLHPNTKEPVGDPFAVYHSHNSRRSIKNIQAPNWTWVSVARDKMVFSMGELTGNIWLMETSAP